MADVMDCPRCGAEGMIFYPGETYDVDVDGTPVPYTEPDMHSCPDCGHDVIERKVA